MLQATVQSRIPFKGKTREAGEVLSPEDLCDVSRPVIDALVSQKMIVLSEEGAASDGEKTQHLQAQVDRLREDVAAMRSALPDAVEAAVLKALDGLTAPAPAQRGRKPKEG